jgi:hypothetical protein
MPDAAPSISIGRDAAGRITSVTTTGLFTSARQLLELIQKALADCRNLNLQFNAHGQVGVAASGPSH